MVVDGWRVIRVMLWASFGSGNRVPGEFNETCNMWLVNFITDGSIEYEREQHSQYLVVIAYVDEYPNIIQTRFYSI